MAHTLHHALRPAAAGCRCNMREITSCVLCGRRLSWPRTLVDTCGGSCARHLRALQRSAPGAGPVGEQGANDV